MRSVWVLPILAVAVAAAAQPEKPDELLKPAIAAAGSAETLLKYRGGHAIGKGTMSFAGADTPFTFEQTHEIPGKLRTVVRCEVKGQKWELVQVFDGENARQTINARVIPATEIALKEMQFAALLNEVALLVPLGNDKRFTVKIAKPEKPGESIGLFVQARGHPDLRLTFDRKTSHLVRIAYRSNDPDAAKDADTEMVFSDFKTVSGLTRPSRTVVTRDGKTVLDLTLTKWAPLEKVDARAFTIEEETMPPLNFVVDRREAGKTLAAVLRARFGLSWSKAKRLVEGKHVKVSGQVESDIARRFKPGKRVEVEAGTIEVPASARGGEGEGEGENGRKGAQTKRPAPAPKARANAGTTPSASPPPPSPLSPSCIVYADDAVAVVNKPPGLTTMRHKEEAAEFGARARRFLPITLADMLPALLGATGRPVIAVHRIDRDTSGLVVFARTPDAAKSLMKQFRKHSVDRRYLAITRGVPTETRIESVLVRDRGDGRRGTTRKTKPIDGKRAVTHVVVRETFGDFALVECRLETGRTHQVRIHLGEAGAPLCGETVYDRPVNGKPQPDGSGAKRPMLHAGRLGFQHPETGETMAWDAPPPEDFTAVLKQLRRK